MGIYLRIIQHYPYPSIVFRCFENKEGTETSWPRSVRWPGLVSSCFRLQLNFTFTFSFLLHQPELMRKPGTFICIYLEQYFMKILKKLEQQSKLFLLIFYKYLEQQSNYPYIYLNIFRTAVKISLPLFTNIQNCSRNKIKNNFICRLPRMERH